jgi:hypothetical protein
MSSKVDISDTSSFKGGDLAVNIRSRLSRTFTGVSTRTDQTDATTRALLDSAERKMAFRMLFGVFITILINYM